MQMVRGPEPSPWRDTNPRNTGERQSHLGESCTVWDAWRVASGPTGGLTHLSCITDDGIELWHKSVARDGVLSSAEATRVERRPVAPDEVRPLPMRLLPDWWQHDLDGATPSAAPDHEAVMMREGTAGVRTIRQHGAWQSVEGTGGGARHLRVTQHAARGGAALEYSSDESGAAKLLSITRAAPPSSDASPPKGTPRVDLNRAETVLDEGCRWFDMSPALMDAGWHACLTDDGIVLKESRRTIGTTSVWTAVRLVRRPVDLDEIKLPDVLRDARAWGID
jgi:hypothetical protein